MNNTRHNENNRFESKLDEEFLAYGYSNLANVDYMQEIQVEETPAFSITHKNSCARDQTYSTNTVKTAFELPFAALFKDTKGEKKFEASSLIKVRFRFFAFVK